MANTPSRITLSRSQDIPFNRLVLSQANVRRVQAGISIEELAEDMLGAFLESDRGFAKARKEVPPEATAGTAQPRPARRSPSQSPSTTSQED